MRIQETNRPPAGFRGLRGTAGRWALLIGIALVAVLVLWLWTGLGMGAQPGPRLADAQAGKEGVGQSLASEKGEDGDTGRRSAPTQPATARADPSKTTLLLRALRVDTREPIANLGLVVVPFRESVYGRRWEGATDAGGYLRLEGIPEGDKAVSPGRSRNPIKVLAGRESYHELLYTPRFCVEGRVTDENGNPLRGASIYKTFDFSTPMAVSKVAQTTSEGRFFLRNWTNQVYLYARYPGLAPSMVYTLSASPETTVKLTLVLTSTAGSVHGSVVDKDGRPVAKARVTIRGSHEGIHNPGDPSLFAANGFHAPAETQLSDESGAFRFEDVPSGNASLRVRKQGFAPARHRIQVETGRASVLRVELAAGVTLVGKVTDSDGQAIEGAKIVVAYDPVRQISTLSDARGRYRLASISPGRFSVVTHHPSFCRHSQRFEGLDGQVLVLDAQLQRGHVIRGRLLNAKGVPLKGWTIRAMRAGHVTGWAHTDAAGQFTLTQLELAEYTLLVYGYRSGRPTLRIPSVRPAAKERVIRLQPGQEPTAFIVGTLQDASGRVPAMASLRVHRKEPDFSRRYPVAKTDGAFRLGPLQPGSYRLVARDLSNPELDLGEVSLVADEVLDLGTCQFKASVPLRIELRADKKEHLNDLRCYVLDRKGVEILRRRVRGDEILEVQRLPAGSFTIHLVGRHVPFTQRKIRLFDGRPETLRISLEAGQPCVVRLETAPGLPLPPTSTLTVHDGRGKLMFSIGMLQYSAKRGLPLAFSPGTYQLTATCEAGLVGKKSVVVSMNKAGAQLIEVEMR